MLYGEAESAFLEGLWCLADKGGKQDDSQLGSRYNCGYDLATSLNNVPDFRQWHGDHLFSLWRISSSDIKVYYIEILAATRDGKRHETDRHYPTDAVLL